MIYAQFFHRDLAGNIAEACGEHAILIIDSDLSRLEVRKIALDACRERGYAAWRLFRGEDFGHDAPMGDISYPPTDRPRPDPIWLRAHD